MKVGDTVELKCPKEPECLPRRATVLNTWWDHTGTIQHIEVFCPKLGDTRQIRADLFEVISESKEMKHVL